MLKIIFYSANHQPFKLAFQTKYLTDPNLKSEFEKLGSTIEFVDILDSNLKGLFGTLQLEEDESQILFLDDQGKYLMHRTKPELEYSWLEICKTFLKNYSNPKPNSQGYYCWGQIVPETTEYLCIDCGFIESFEKGQVFPICIVCLSGDPTTEPNYSGPEEGFWEMV